MAYFRCGGNGNTIMIDGQEYDDDLNLVKENFIYIPYPNLPVTDYNFVVVSHRDIIYVFGGSNRRDAYMYDTKNVVNKWQKINDLPYELNSNLGSAIVFNNEIYIIGCDVDRRTVYKFTMDNGGKYTLVTTTPYDCKGSSFVVLNGELHMLGGFNNNYAHYKFNGTSWNAEGNIPYPFSGSSAVVLNDEIHVLGSNIYYNGSGSSHYTKHYKWKENNGWSNVSILPHDFYEKTAIVFHNEIYLLGVADGTIAGRFKHYKFNGKSWNNVNILQGAGSRNCAIPYNDGIFILPSKHTGGSSADSNECGIITDVFIKR